MNYSLPFVADTKNMVLSMRFIGLWLLYGLSFLSVSAQETGDYVWFDPLEQLNQIEGQGWPDIGFNRLPDKAEHAVRDAVWSLSKHAAGLSIRFVTDADSLEITYEVDGNYAMNHMPATGVSGVDLYGKDDDGRWLWYRGKNTFGDKVVFHFKTEKSGPEGRRYQLYLPLYNNCKNLRFGITKGRKITFLPVRTEKPVLVYGTSITQGACASRPGMAWTNVLGRKLNYPITNLGFSGNGRLEPEVMEFITQVDAAVYVLDCLPNLGPNETRNEAEIKKRLYASIKHIRDQKPKADILLTHHAGYSDGEVDSARKAIYETLNRWTTEVFDELRSTGEAHLFMLTKKEINLSNDAFVDGTHPTDLGMEQYAKAYEKKLTEIVTH